MSSIVDFVGLLTVVNVCSTIAGHHHPPRKIAATRKSYEPHEEAIIVQIYKKRESLDSVACRAATLIGQMKASASR